MNVLIKLKRLQETLKRNGRMKLMYQELLQREVPDSGNEKMTTEELEKALKTAKEAVVKAVLGSTLLISHFLTLIKTRRIQSPKER